MLDLCVNHVNISTEQWFTQMETVAKIEINWLEQWVMSITGPLCHQSYEVLLLQRRKYNNDLSHIKMMSAIVDYYGR